jgi:hypothetical protein
MPSKWRCTGKANAETVILLYHSFFSFDTHALVNMYKVY